MKDLVDKASLTDVVIASVSIVVGSIGSVRSAVLSAVISHSFELALTPDGSSTTSLALVNAPSMQLPLCVKESSPLCTIVATLSPLPQLPSMLTRSVASGYQFQTR